MVRTVFRVVPVDAGLDAPAPDQTIEAQSPEEAAWLATGERLTRRSKGATVLRAKVYWPEAATGQLTLVRLYRSADGA